jgi:glucose/arabinose dehydrogenase
MKSKTINISFISFGVSWVVFAGLVLLIGLLLVLGTPRSQAAFAQESAQQAQSPNRPNLPPNDPSITYSFEPIISSGLTRPIFVTHANDDRLFIMEQGGLIKIWQGGALLPTAFLSLTNIVKTNNSGYSEEGLLGLAFEPNYASTGRFYVYYTNSDGDQNIARYTVSSGNPNVADPLSATILMTIAHPSQGNHNGGWMDFGPDSYLYVAVGDGGGGSDPFCAALNTNDRRGKILRLDVVGQATYTTPATNIFTATQLPEVWAIGLRNPWRNSFDRQTGDLYVGDVGQGSWEEVTFIPASSASGVNFGWSKREGRNSFSNACPSSNIAATEPFTDYAHNPNGGYSVTGGYVYRGANYPWLSGNYFFGDYSTGNLWAAWQPGAAGAFSTTKITTLGFNLSSFGEDSSGEVYLADYAGHVLRLTSEQAPTITVTPTPTTTPTLTPTLTQTNLPDLTISGMQISIQFDGNGCYTSTLYGTYVTVQNAGLGNAGPFSVTLNGAPMRVGGGLNAGQSTRLWFPAEYPIASAVADSDNEVTESNETNNTRTEMLPIPTLPPPCSTATPTRTPSPTRTPTRTPTLRPGQPTATATRTPTRTVTVPPGTIVPRVSLPLVLAGVDVGAGATTTPTTVPTGTPTMPPSPTRTSTATMTP